MRAQSPDQRPALRVVSGDATPEEIAAVLTAVAAAVPDAEADRSAVGPGTTSVWAQPTRRARQVRAAFRPGPHAWRTAFWPR
jgi:Acyl-CoA carboxylase epsilon subunit